MVTAWNASSTGILYKYKFNFLSGSRAKGGTGVGIGQDPIMSALDSTKLADEAAARKKYMSVSPADGAATIAETDLKTGVGDFPKALPFTANL